MSDKSAAELEREADIARAKVTDTADSIRHKMTPGQLIDEFTGAFAGGDVSSMLGNLRSQIRDNPLPITMVGAGLAWLMLGKGPSVSTLTDDINFGAASSRVSQLRADSNLGNEPGVGDIPGDTGSMVTQAADSLTSAANRVADTASGIADNARKTMEEARIGIGSGAAYVGQSFQDLLKSEPLAVAALGLVVGTAIGAILPRTQAEDEMLGTYRDKLGDDAASALDRGIDQAKEVAAEAYVTLKKEADKLTSDSSEPLAGRVAKALSATAGKAEDAVRERLPGDGRSPDGDMEH